MGKSVSIALVLAMAAAVGARADEQAEAKALVAKALKAVGGEAKAAKFLAETFKGKGKSYALGEAVDFTGEWALQHPDKGRVQIDGEAGGQKFTFIRVSNGAKVWQKLNDKTTEITDKDQLAEVRAAAHTGWVTSLVPLKDKAFKLSAIGEVKVGDKPALGVRVVREGQRDVTLFFDKASGLLVRSETMVKDVMAGGKEITQEMLFSDYKDVDGFKTPMKLVINHDGKKYLEMEMTDVKLLEKLDDSVFGEP